MEKRCSLKEKVYNDILDGIVRGEKQGRADSQRVGAGKEVPYQ